MTKKILACIDGSPYADVLCAYAAWAADRMDAKIDVLHVLRRHSEYAPQSDLSGSIGLGARTSLLDELTKLDEERAKLDQQKGKIILDHALEILKAQGADGATALHKRGSLVENVTDLEAQAELILIGKSGEHVDHGAEYLGENLEKVARAVHKPLLVAMDSYKPVERFLIAYDGGQGSAKAVEFAVGNNLLKGLECHLIVVESAQGQISTKNAEDDLHAAGYVVKTVRRLAANHPEEEIIPYAAENAIDLLLIGAYSHSRIRSFFLGSTTTALIRNAPAPLLMFK